MKHHISISLALLAAAAASTAAAQDMAAGAKLARETMDLISLQDHMMVTAIRQKNDRKGAADYQRFIIDPIERLSDRWSGQPPTVKVHFVACATALQEHENHARDSFKAGQIGKPSSLRGQAVETCRATIGHPGGAAQK